MFLEAFGTSFQWNFKSGKKDSNESSSNVLEAHYKKTEQLRRAYCSGCKNRRYMSPTAALFWPAAVHEIYCGVPYACRNSCSILRRTIAAG